MEKKNKQFSIWVLIWGLGLAGQLCWNMENQWFNTFVYSKIGKDPSIITGMLICSALATTFSTFFFGTWSDRLGNRRKFMAFGYILWGLFTIGFGLTQFISREMYTLLAIMVVMADTIMSFFGSMGNDSAFNTWCNDIMTNENRGGIGAALATQPVIGTILGTVIGGFLVGSNDNYMRLFLVMGAAVIAFGIFTLFALGPEYDVSPSKKGSFWHQFALVFNFKEFFKHKELALVHVGIAVFFSGFNVYFAYIGNFIIHYLGFTPDQMGIIEAVPLGLAMLFAIPISKLINRGYHRYIAFAGVIINAVGCALAYLIRPENIDSTKIFNPIIFIGIFVIGIGYVAILQTCKVWAKQLYPRDSKGQFEGIWVLFFVLIPMIFGSVIGEAVVKTGGEQFLDTASGQMQYIPNENIFLVGGIVILFSIIPFLMILRSEKKEVN